MGAPLPVLLDLHAQIEEDLASEQSLDLLTGFGPDGLDRLPALADDDPLLGIALDEDRGPDLEKPVLPLLVVLGDHGDRVRQLLPGPRAAASRGPARPRTTGGAGPCWSPAGSTSGPRAVRSMSESASSCRRRLPSRAETGMNSSKSPSVRRGRQRLRRSRGGFIAIDLVDDAERRASGRRADRDATVSSPRPTPDLPSTTKSARSTSDHAARGRRRSAAARAASCGL